MLKIKDFNEILVEKMHAQSDNMDQTTEWTPAPLSIDFSVHSFLKRQEAAADATLNMHIPLEKGQNVKRTYPVRKTAIHNPIADIKTAEQKPVIDDPPRAATSSQLLNANVAIEPTIPLANLTVHGQLALRLLDLVIDIKSGPSESGNMIRLSDVKRAYRRKARLMHPDFNPGADTQSFALLKESYDLLASEIKTLLAS